MMTQGGRLLHDADGIEWEVYDEGVWNAALALIDFPVQRENPGLLFISSRDMRRIHPRPTDWSALSDDELVALCARAASLF
ncbi:MAG: hypothetical protein NVS4B3_08750 [Gemmatimonadaceae bacterium]